jgi:hypothetical protein
MKPHIKKPDRYADPLPQRHQKKWARIIDAFMKGNIDELKKIHRTGARGRIFAILVGHMLKALQIKSEPEPIFDHITPHKWYLDFALANNLKIKTYAFYNAVKAIPSQFLHPRVLSKQPVRYARNPRYVLRFHCYKGKGQAHPDAAFPEGCRIGHNKDQPELVDTVSQNVAVFPVDVVMRNLQLHPIGLDHPVPAE